MERKVNCRHCGRWSQNRGRGLCISCKKVLVDAGRIDELYPKRYGSGPAKKRPRPIRDESPWELTEELGQWVAQDGISVWVPHPTQNSIDA